MTEPVETAIALMPRGGPEASWLDRLLQTDALEYTDRYDVDDAVKQRVINALDRMGAMSGGHEQHARTALELVAHIDTPRILEIGAGHGRLSEKILELHPTATVTISDLDPASVANIAAGELGRNPRARTQVIDASAIDAADDSYDLVVFAQAFHHLPPQLASQAIAEATRVGRRFLVIDLKRQSPLTMVASAPLMAPAAAGAVVCPWLRPLLHDGLISALRAYSRSAFIALGKTADPQMGIDFKTATSRWPTPTPTIVVFSRPGHAPSTAESAGGNS